MIRALRNFWFPVKSNMEETAVTATNAVKRKADRTQQTKERPKKVKFADKYEGEYFFDLQSGLRFVYPYRFVYRSHVKRRWVGETILNVYKREFRAYQLQLVLRKFRDAEILVNDKQVAQDYRLKDKDVIVSHVHRHEGPVLACPIEIIEDSADLLVINKPASIPVHPCGKYRLNSLLAILYKEHKREELHIVHRLDRMTSGLLIFAKNPQIASQVAKQIGERTVCKEYICKVEGEFPDGEVSCEQPIDRLCQKLGIHYVSESGKESLTIFKKVYSDGKHSIVHCRPKTGRTHQIRIHLQYLGYPIVNDPLYNSYAFGPSKGKLGDYQATKEELIERIYKAHPVDKWVDEEIVLEPGKVKADAGEDKEKNNTEKEKELDKTEADKADLDKTDLDKTESDKTEKPEFDEFQFDGLDENAIKAIEARLFEKNSEHFSFDSEKLEELLEQLRKSSSFCFENDEFVEKLKQNLFEKHKLSCEVGCPECRRLFIKPSGNELFLCLHALRYKLQDREFYAEPPGWAKMSQIDFKNL